MLVIIARRIRRSGNLPLAVVVLAILMLLAVQACTPSAPSTTEEGQEATVGLNVGNLAPDFTLDDLEGGKVRLSDLRGSAVFINFWATWCPPCRAEMPEIEAIHQKYKDKGVVVIGVDIMEPESTVRRFIQEGGYTWTFAMDTSGEVSAQYNITAIPTSYFIDREGIIRAVNIGAMTKRAMEDKLAEAMK